MKFHKQITKGSLIILFLLIFPISIDAQKKIGGYLHIQYNQTIQDRTTGNNPWGAGAGFQLFFNTHDRIKPSLELTADGYLEDDKVLRLTPDNKPIEDIRSMINLLGGVSFLVSKCFYLSMMAGDGFINGKNHLTIKPSMGFYFVKQKKWTAKVSYIHVYNRDKATKEDFSSLSFSLGVKVF
jgi:hypothetical protein